MDDRAEWLEADGLGGFASGTVSGIRTRRYHALLLAARRPPTERFVLVNGVEAWVETSSGPFPLSSHRYPPDVVHPDGARRIAGFERDPWPAWTYRLEDGTLVRYEAFVPKGRPLVALSWRLLEARPGVRLAARPLLSGRDYHALHRENPAFRFDAEEVAGGVRWRPYGDVPSVTAFANGRYGHAPDWYRSFLYDAEQARGLEALEDLASPGVFRWDLSAGEAVLLLTTEEGTKPDIVALRETERKRRAAFASPLHRSADAYVVARGEGKTIVAGYPWFTDWGRDTFIAVRGLCLAGGGPADARAILGAWAEAVSEGMLPNRFPDRGEAPEFNSVDASLWFVVAAHELMQRHPDRGAAERPRFERAIGAILDGYAKGTRYGIRMDADGLLAAGEPGVQLTWMDAKVGDRVITPRIGKPVEVQALWLNALRIGSGLSGAWARAFTRASVSFRERFWDEARGCLYDVVDVDHVAGKVDSSFRPNQIFAVGGLPHAALAGERARRVVDAVEARLWTPMGLRTLAPDEAGYVGRYDGGVAERDVAYHQGTVWPWLAGPFVEAWVRVRGGTPEAKREARARFLAPLLRHLDTTGIGHVSEIADGDAPHTPRGCPFQAWSLGELMRLDLEVLAE